MGHRTIEILRSEIFEYPSAFKNTEYSDATVEGFIFLNGRYFKTVLYDPIFLRTVHVFILMSYVSPAS